MNIITISGTPGSGKSTVCTILKEKTNLNYIYSGMIFRQLAEKHNMKLSEFGKYCEQNPQVDKEIDEKQLQILKKGDVLLEGRLSGWIAYKNKIPALKIMIDADIKTRAERIVKREGGNIEKRQKEMLEREKSEAKRYEKYYNIDLKETSIYDMVIDSSDKTAEQIADIILEKI